MATPAQLDNNNFNLLGALGKSSGVKQFSAHGQRDGVDTIDETIWNGTDALYPFGTLVTEGGQRFHASSTSGAGDASGGAGVRKIFLEALDEDYNIVREVLEMGADGSVPVFTTATNLIRVNHFRAVDAGLNMEAVGTITLQTETSNTVIAQIDSETSRMNQAVMTVPAGKTYVLKEIHLNMDAGTINRHAYYHINTRDPDENVKWRYEIASLNTDTQGTVQQKYDIPVVFPEKRDIFLTSVVGGGNVNVSALMRGFFIRN